MANNDKKFQKINDSELENTSGGASGELYINKSGNWLLNKVVDPVYTIKFNSGTYAGETMKFKGKESAIAFLKDGEWTYAQGSLTASDIFNDK